MNARGSSLAAGVAASAVALPVLGCGGTTAPADGSSTAATGSAAAAAQPSGVRIRLSSLSQRVLLARRRAEVRVRATRGGTVRIALQAIERVPGRTPGPLQSLTRSRALSVPAGGQDVTARLPLTRAGLRAVTTCARLTLRVTLTRGRAVAAGAERLDSPRCARFFSPRSVWNTAVPADAPIDPRSAAMVADLGAQVRDAEQRRYGPTINTINYSTPVVEVARNQPRVRVTLDDTATYRRPVRAALRSVPLPGDARPAAGTDAHLVLWQPSTDTMWEFWKLRRARDGWHAKAAGRIRHVARSKGILPALEGATATSLPLAGGLIRPEQLRAGRIDHALALAIPRPRAGVWTFPAQRTDGFVRDAAALPEGAHLRLDPALDVRALGLPPGLQTLALAAQRYGMVVRDTAGTVALYAEAPTTQRPISYRDVFGDGPVWELLSRLPWDRLQVLRMHLTTYRGAPTS
ncbi:MAG TPA: hypothetical protein VNT55_23230 [Baekduia sp.]|nr:hypothetical protein [Baekduia sp.]